MGIVSNGERSQQQYKFLRSGIDHYFGPLILSGECGMAKPARSIFELACDSTGVSPSQAVYVGDRRDIDAEAERSVGMHCPDLGPGEIPSVVRAGCRAFLFVRPRLPWIVVVGDVFDRVSEALVSEDADEKANDPADHQPRDVDDLENWTEQVERLSLKCRETNEVLMAHWRQKHKNSGSSPKTP